MSHECHQGSCCTQNHHSHSSCHSSSGCCEDQDCGCSCHHHGQKYSDELLALADEAWMELIKDKIKEEIKKNSGEHIDRIASLVAKTNHARWKFKMDEKQNEHTYEDELHTLLFCKK